MKTLFPVLMLLTAALTASAGFELRENAGACSVLCNGRVLISGLKMVLTPGEALPADTRTSCEKRPDGTHLYWLWNENPETRFRCEVAVRPDLVEITMAGEAPAFATQLDRELQLFLPYEAFRNVPYRALAGNGREFREVKGVFPEQPPKEGLPDIPFRFLAANICGSDLIFDFMPLGAGDYCTTYKTGVIRGVWMVTRGRNKDSLRFSCGAMQPWFGGFTGTKLVIREGKFKDYDKLHALRKFHYGDHLAPERLYSFGAKKHGKNYTALDTIGFDAARQAGWLAPERLAVVNGAPEGVFYSHVAGKDGRIRVTGLRDGWYAVTVGAGNYTGGKNKFGISVNGTVLANDLTVAPRTAVTVGRAVRIENGTAEVKLDGDFVISTLGFQCVLTKYEDYCIERGFWVADGFEPGSIYRNEDYKKPPLFAVAKHVFDLPEPGKEAEGRPRPLKRETLLPDPNSPELAWLNKVQMIRILSNSATMAELSAPGAAGKLLDRELAARPFNSAMVSGMHSRHTYFNHLKRGIEAVRQLAQACHARNIKLIDHHDATLLWHSDAGLRVLLERLPELHRALADELPTFQFCPLNPVFNETYYGYLMELVKAGVDGFQIDELNIWGHSCGCQYCRAKFHEDTGWYLPVNELDKRLNNLDSELWKVWFEWRRVQIGNWFVELRRRAMPYNPDLTLCMYTTHWGYTRSHTAYNSSRDLNDLGRAVNFFGTEVMTRNPLLTVRSLLPFRKMKNVLNLAYGAPIWSWIYSGHWDTAYCGYAASNMAGQVALLPQLTRPQNGSDYPAFDSSPDNMTRGKAVPVAETLLYFSTASRDWNRYASFDAELFGTAQVLEMLHTPYQFISRETLTADRLKRAKVLILGADGCLSDEELALIKEFARAGGVVYMSTVAGMFNELGIDRETWGFADVFGFEPKIGKRGHIFKVGPSRDGTNAVTLKEPVRLNIVLPKKIQAEVVAWAFDKPGRPLPAAFRVPCGKGAMVYQIAPLGSQCFEQEQQHGKKWRPLPNAEALEPFYLNFLAEIVKPGAYWSGNMPKKVFTAIWREGDELLIHFLNGTGSVHKQDEIMTLKPPKIPYPALAEDVVFTVPGKWREAVAVSPDFAGRKPLALRAAGEQGVTVTLPKELLKAYTIVRLK